MVAGTVESLHLDTHERGRERKGERVRELER